MILEHLGTKVFISTLFHHDMYSFRFTNGDIDRFRSAGMEPMLPDNYRIDS